MKQKTVKLLFIQWLLLTLELKLPETLLLLVAFWGVFVGKYILTTVAQKKFSSFRMHERLYRGAQMRKWNLGFIHGTGLPAFPPPSMDA